MFLICNSIPGIENNNKVIFSYKITKYLKKKEKEQNHFSHNRIFFIIKQKCMHINQDNIN